MATMGSATLDKKAAGDARRAAKENKEYVKSGKCTLLVSDIVTECSKHEMNCNRCVLFRKKCCPFAMWPDDWDVKAIEGALNGNAKKVGNGGSVAQVNG